MVRRCLTSFRLDIVGLGCECPLMRIIILSVLSLLAFAANSILNRAGVADGAIGPASFAAVRVASAFAVLAVVFWTKERRLPARPAHMWGPVGLLIYILGFSFGYLGLNAGFGALLLFGAVIGAQFGTRASALLRGEQLRGLLALMVLAVCVKLGFDLALRPDDLFSVELLK